MAWAIFSQKMSSVWTTCAICSNGLGYPFEKNCYPFENEIVDRSSDWSYLFKDKC